MKCAGCSKPIVGDYIYHYRLGEYVHGTDECMRDVHGEDIRLHTVRWVPEESRTSCRFALLAKP